MTVENVEAKIIIGCGPLSSSNVKNVKQGQLYEAEQ